MLMKGISADAHIVCAVIVYRFVLLLSRLNLFPPPRKEGVLCVLSVPKMVVQYISLTSFLFSWSYIC